MRILYMGNNWLGWQVLTWLKEQGEDIAALAVHPPDRRKYGGELLNAADLAPDRVFDALALHQPGTLDAIRQIRPDVGVSVLFGYILKPELLKLFPAGCINLHPAFLPYNRGAYPNVWSIIDGTPSGVTLHYVDEGVDTGDIIAQKRVPVEPVDTGESLYHKLEQASLELFIETWPLFRNGQTTRTMQTGSGGSSHRVRDIEQVDEIDPDRQYTARELIDLLRARTFPPYPGVYMTVGGRKIYLRLELSYEEAPQAGRL
jgi:methionyl-tRNA formyltransferase